MKSIILLLANLTLFLGLNAQQLDITHSKNSNNNVFKFEINDQSKINWIVVEKFDATANKYSVVKDVQANELSAKNTCAFYIVDNNVTKNEYNSSFVVKVYTTSNKYIQYNSVEENNQLVFKAAAKTESSLDNATYARQESNTNFSIEFAWNREEIEQIFAKNEKNNVLTASNNGASKVAPKYTFAPKVDFESAMASISAAKSAPTEMNFTSDEFENMAKAIEMREDEICNQEYAEMVAFEKMNEPAEISNNEVGLRVLQKEEDLFLSYTQDLSSQNDELKIASESDETEEMASDINIDFSEEMPSTK